VSARRLLPLVLIAAALRPELARAQKPGTTTHTSVIADANGDGRLDREGDTVTVAGRASIPSGVLFTDRLSIWIQDATGGIQLYRREKPLPISVGDSVVARGLVTHYYGAPEIRVHEYRVIPGAPVPPAPRTIAIDSTAMLANSGRLVTVEGRLVGWGGDPSGVYAILRSLRDTGHVALYVPTPIVARVELTRYGRKDRLRVTGVVVPYTPLDQEPGQPRVRFRVIPRSAVDVKLVGMSFVRRQSVGLAMPAVLLAALIAVIVLRREVARKTRRLLESEQRYRSLYEYNPDPVAEFDLAGNISAANAAFQHTLCPTAMHGASKTLAALVAEQDWTSVEAHFRAACSGEARNFEMSTRAHAGTPRRLDVTFTPVVVSGKVTGVYLLANDITARTEARAAIEGNARLLSSVVETQQVIAQAELDILSVAQRIVEQVTRLMSADLVEIGFVEGDEIDMHPHLRNQVAEDIPRRVPIDGSLRGLAVRTGEIVRTDDALADARVFGETACGIAFRSVIVVPLIYGGTTIGVLAVSWRAPNAFHGNDEHALRLLAGLLAADLSHARAFEAKQQLIAERTAALDALQVSEERFRTMIENASDPVSILEPSGVFKWLSPAVQRMTGYSPEELTGRNAFDRVHTEDAPRVLAALAETIAHPGATGSVEYRLRHRDDSWRVISTIGRNMVDDPAVRGIVLNSRDITEQRKLEEQLRHAQKMEAVGQLAGGIAHDFNNILTVIRVHSQFLTEALAERDPRRTDALEIERASDRAASLTKQLLAFSRRQILQPRVLDLNETFKGVEPMLRRLIGEDISIVTRLESKLGHITADRGQLEQVLMNLVVNARDAMPKGGTLTIATDDITIDENDPLAEEIKAGRYARLEVVDTGCGMDAVTRRRVFEPFFTTKEQGKGTGLGLATVYGVVQQSGGTITVESELAAGSTFRIYLPCVPVPPAPDAASAVLATPARGTETILVVEDEDAVRSLARRILGARGYRIIEARNGKEALDITRTSANDIHLVLTDVVMPEMGGRELAEALSAERPEARVLFMSGYTDDDILRRGLNAPGVAFLHKPFTVRDLTETVRKSLDGVEVETL
jgi:two-component system, cell cycle sensor histidine kinase and response regulator CckA